MKFTPANDSTLTKNINLLIIKSKFIISNSILSLKTAKQIFNECCIIAVVVEAREISSEGGSSWMEVKRDVCIDTYGKCEEPIILGVDACRGRCFQQWGGSNWTADCVISQVPQLGTICYCSHDCPKN